MNRNIDTIFFDVGATLRFVVEDAEFAVIWIIKRQPALRAPATSRDNVSPTYASSEGDRCRRRSATRKISGDGLRMPVSLERTMQSM